MKFLLLLITVIFLSGCYAGPSAREIADAIHRREYNTVLYTTSTGSVSRMFQVKNNSGITTSIKYSGISYTATTSESIVEVESGENIILNWVCVSDAELNLYKNRVVVSSCAGIHEYKFDEQTRKFYEPEALNEIHKYFPNFNI